MDALCSGSGEVSTRQRASAHVGAKRSDPFIGINRKDEVFTAFHHAVHNRLHHRVAGVEKDMVGLKPIELKGELNDLELGSAEQGKAEVEPGSGNLGRYRHVTAKRQKRIGSVPFFHQPQGATRHRRRHEVSD
jgi:hypothetical protein